MEYHVSAALLRAGAERLRLPYVMSVIPDRDAPSPASVIAAFRQEEDAVAPKYRELVQVGALT